MEMAGARRLERPCVNSGRRSDLGWGRSRDLQAAGKMVVEVWSWWGIRVGDDPQRRGNGGKGLSGQPGIPG